MENEILLAVVQAATEFLPISSSGHLALISNLVSEPNLFLITILHFASLLAVLIFTRKEIFELLSFKKETKNLWIYLIVATIPAALFGFFFKPIIESFFSSFLFIGIAFLFTGAIIFLTKISVRKGELNWKSSLIIGLFQVLALFPGVSRSGITISSALFFGVSKDKAVKFSFLLFVPLVIGAAISEIGNAYFSSNLVIAFLICFFLSWIFLHALYYFVRKGMFWIFSIYCFVVGLISLAVYFT